MHTDIPVQRTIKTKFKHSKILRGSYLCLSIVWLLFAIDDLVRRQNLIMCFLNMIIAVIWFGSYLWLSKSMFPSFIIAAENLIVARAPFKEIETIPWNLVAGIEKGLFDTRIQLRGLAEINIPREKFTADELMVLTDAVQKAININTDTAAVPNKNNPDHSV